MQIVMVFATYVALILRFSGTPFHGEAVLLVHTQLPTSEQFMYEALAGNPLLFNAETRMLFDKIGYSYGTPVNEIYRNKCFIKCQQRSSKQSVTKTTARRPKARPRSSLTRHHRYNGNIASGEKMSNRSTGSRSSKRRCKATLEGPFVSQTKRSKNKKSSKPGARRS